VVLLLGAGFNVDAPREAGVSVPSLTNPGEALRYPLVTDLARTCFGTESPSPGQSIEDMIESATRGRDYKPIRMLYKMIMEADYRIGASLASRETADGSLYGRFLTDFEGCSILTFNYDSLVEMILMRSGHWYPIDGYGLPVVAGLPPDRTDVPTSSQRHVLHLHGTLCVYPKTFDGVRVAGPGMNIELHYKDEPDFVFDPDSIARCFAPFEKGLQRGIGYRYPEERVIAPVPDKTEGLKEHFIQRVYERAVEAARAAEAIVAIGYSFNRHDSSSYGPLLQSARTARIVVVDPNANRTVSRLRLEYRNLRWEAVSLGFRDWTLRGYPGLTA
jgi:hypothetical protein